MKAALTSDDGFTLAEAMMSLLVIGLAFGGLIQVAAQGAKTQARSIVHQKDMKLADQQAKKLEAEFEMTVPADGEDFTGRRDYLSVNDQVGHAHLYRAPTGWQLNYVSGGKLFHQWPRQGDETLAVGEDRPRLEAVALSDAKGTPITLIKLRTEQAATCQFDMISRQCRGARS